MKLFFNHEHTDDKVISNLKLFITSYTLKYTIFIHYFHILNVYGLLVIKIVLFTKNSLS